VEGRRIRVVVVDDHHVLRHGVRALLAESFDVVGEAGDVESALELIRDTHPEVVLVDVNLEEGGHGATIVRRARGDGVYLAFSAMVDREAVMEMIAAGASGYVSKQDTGLARAVEMVAAGIPYFSRELASIVRAQPDVWSELGDDEKEVMDFVVGGMEPGDVADQLGIPVDRVHEIYRSVLEIARLRGAK